MLLKRYIDWHSSVVAGPFPRPTDWPLERSRQTTVAVDHIIARHNVSSWSLAPFDLDQSADAEEMEDLIRWNLVHLAAAMAATPKDHPRRKSLGAYFESFARGLAKRVVRGDAFDPLWDD